MRIYSMTATFGKLEHKTLTLQPGLNIIQAPNEWGKSTWCAFLVAMLYGIDTRERSTQMTLADKTRYAPWSGSPMSGRMDICWNGRDITIERATRGRSIFGHFRAYETNTGLEVMELTAANCGTVLLGVEKEVFTRSGFLRLTDLQVTDDEALRRRLNALVTTGDDSGAADQLAQRLKELKNQCRANRVTGLIPKAEARCEELQTKLRQLEQLQDTQEKLQLRQAQLEVHQQKLQNHQAVLQYEAAREQTRKAETARQRLQSLQAQQRRLEDRCAELPCESMLLQNLAQLAQLRQQSQALELEVCMESGTPNPPQTPEAFRGCTPEQAVQEARRDALLYAECIRSIKKFFPWIFAAGAILLAAGAICLLLKLQLPGLVLAALGLGGAIGGLIQWLTAKNRKRHAVWHAGRIAERYGALEVSQWEAAAQEYAEAQREYAQELAACRESNAALQARKAAIEQQMQRLTGGVPDAQQEQLWQEALAQHRAYADGLRELRATEELVAVLGDTEPLQRPDGEDTLQYTREETARLLSDCAVEQRQLQKQLGHCQGQMEALGQQTQLRQQLEEEQTRLQMLEELYAALELAQQTLQEASMELQRRFAPRIAQRTRELFAKLTDQRYDRLVLREDLTLSVAALGEDTLHDALWRSDGTIDQLHLALRLAVAEVLTPQAPLVLDDALVRFDDKRLAAAMEILKEAAKNKQVILFTCQSREADYYKEESL